MSRRPPADRLLFQFPFLFSSKDDFSHEHEDEA
jgi:hypothetical protein